MNIGTISQPNYLPWLGYFEKIFYADSIIWLDHVQYSKNTWINRNKIINGNGQEMWLTIPIVRSPLNTSINKILIDYRTDWVNKHLKSIYLSYKKSPFFKGIYPLIESSLEKKSKLLVDLNLELLNSCCKLLKVKKTFYKSSVKIYTSKKAKLVLDICTNYIIDEYYSNLGSKDYMAKEISAFDKNNINVVYQNYQPIPYQQINTDNFIPNMSIIDLLFNESIEKSINIIKAGARH